jgi:hypothetical protein
MRNLYLATAVLLGLTIAAALANVPLGPDFSTGATVAGYVAPDAPLPPAPPRLAALP